ncbi:hypothetical protein V6N13_045530 [Hibiscus sabdariffa]|uniref:Uncharacterized protein n=1 Tax=Hibiscus sabdariffa TaxID=183260 RepID=A0ABR2RLF9_9ROSI
MEHRWTDDGQTDISRLISLAVVFGGCLPTTAFEYEFYENVGFRDMGCRDESGTEASCSLKISETSKAPAAWAILVRRQTEADS